MRLLLMSHPRRILPSSLCSRLLFLGSCHEGERRPVDVLRDARILIMGVFRERPVRLVVLIAAVVAVSLLHYHTPTSHIVLHPILQRAYYIPLLLMALWFGWRGGLIAAAIAALLYVPHIRGSWGANPAYTAASYVEIGMFFVITMLTGILSDQERAQRRTIEHTARRLSEVYAQLQKSFEQLRRADRLSALGELSAGLAHEIRNPLGSIEGAVQILSRRELPEDTRQEFTDLVYREIARLKGLLTNFLEFARPAPPQMVASDVGLLLESVAKLASETATMAKVDLCIKVAGDLPPLPVDAEQIKQVLLNLVINAVQAMPSGGQVTLRASLEGDSARVEVEDEGVGIPAENLERIFDPFFTTRTNGTGLGLSIAYQIVSQHGGHIAAKRNPQRGMTFSVTLPVAKTTVAEPVVQGS